MEYSKRYGTILLIMTVLFALSGCKMYYITTDIDRSGACERTVVIETETGDITDTAYPVPDSTTWDMEVTPNEETDEEDDLIYTFRKRFRSVRAMEREFANIRYPDLRVTHHTELEKRHRWFVTFLTFRESYEPISIYRILPITDWFTIEEIELLITDDADSTLDARAEEWQIRNAYEEFYLYLKEGVTELHSSELTLEILEEGKERLYAGLVPAVEEIDEEDLVDFILEIAQEVFGTAEVSRLRPKVEEFERSLEAYMEFMEDLTEESYEHVVSMPGLITRSNAEDEELNSVSWEISPYTLQYTGVEMWVEARVSNRLAVWVSIILAVALLTVAVMIFLRRT